MIVKKLLEKKKIFQIWIMKYKYKSEFEGDNYHKLIWYDYNNLNKY